MVEVQKKGHTVHASFCGGEVPSYQEGDTGAYAALLRQYPLWEAARVAWLDHRHAVPYGAHTAGGAEVHEARAEGGVLPAVQTLAKFAPSFADFDMRKIAELFMETNEIMADMSWLYADFPKRRCPRTGRMVSWFGRIDRAAIRRDADIFNGENRG